ncbi:DNA polymerase III subunit gamma/tau [Orrella sp. JC864]|uniref:DNA polymerase III subunit gamma/tau n=1 Tax=Orrella sp. JC864 TaxID=3120298 RepID=UPI0030092CDD
MSYLVLARKWRPRSFDTLVGQDHVVRALTHALSTQRLHHAWLFTGTRGVGKTTLSRILAKSLNCETGITPTPCGTCRACTEIDAGRFVDYLELDAASNRGVDEMTQLLEQAVYSPGAGRFKVYMIDEVHMLTGHAFNAMLKTLEEPPPHVKFILATTDPQKIPVTVLSRCLQFNLKQMPGEAIVGHLQHVLDQESIAYEVPALRLIGQAAAGSMRDALSLTDQAIAYSAGNLTDEAVRGMLGTIDQRHLVRLLDALAANDAAAVLAVADELSTRGLSYSGALADLAVLLSRVAIAQRVPGAASPDDPVAADIERLAQTLHPDTLQLFYSVAVHSRGELTLAPDEYAGFVMACLRMLALLGDAPPAPAGGPGGGKVSASPDRPGTPAPAAPAPAPAAAPAAAAPAAVASAAPAAPASAAPEPAASAQAADRPPAAPQAPAAAARTPQAPAAAPVSVPAWEDAPPAAPHVAGRPATDQSAAPEPPDDMDYGDPGYDMAYDGPPLGFEQDGYEPVPMAEPLRREALRAEPPPSAGKTVVAVPAASALGATPTEGDIKLEGEWHRLAARLPVTGLAAELARQSEWAGATGRRITLRVAARTLADSPGRERLRQALAEHFGGHVLLDIEVGSTGAGTAHAVALAEQAARQQAAEQAIQADPFVQALLDDFGGRILPGSIRPVSIPPAAAA